LDYDNSMQCVHCYRSIPDGSDRCPFCGADQTESATNPEYEFQPPPPPGFSAPPTASTGSTLEESQQMWEDWAAKQTLPTRQAADRESEPPSGATRVLGQDPERHKETRVLQAPVAPKLPPNRPDDAEDADSILSRDFEAALQSLTSLYRRLKRAERVALWSAVAAFVAAFSPWYHIEGRGWVSGIETVGWSSALLIGAALVVTYVRLAQRWSGWGALLQFLLLAAAVSASSYYLLVPLPKAAMGFGLPATVAASTVAAVSELLGILSRR